MADAKEALDDVNAMLDEFKKDPNGRFNDAQVVFLIKMWTKTSLAMRGTSVYSTLKIWFNKRGNPGKPDDKNPYLSWRDELGGDLIAFRKALSDGGDAAIRSAWETATNTMRDFVEDYRNRYKPDSTQDKGFARQVTVAFLALDKEIKAGG